MGASLFKINASGNGVIGEAATVPVGDSYRLVSVSVCFTAAPTTSENLTLTLDANHGAAWDVLLYSVDPGAGALTDILWQPDEELFLEGGDAVAIAYAGTDVRPWATQVTLKAV